MAVDPTYVTKNYEQLGGDVWVIGGTLRIATGGKIVPDGGTQGVAPTAPAATAATNSSPYGYSQAQADAVISWIRAVHTILVNAGLMA